MKIMYGAEVHMLPNAPMHHLCSSLQTAVAVIVQLHEIAEFHPYAILQWVCSLAQYDGLHLKLLQSDLKRESWVD